MRTRPYALIILLGVALATASAAVLTTAALAECRDPDGNVVPCDKESRTTRATATEPPTATALPTPTEPPTPTAVAAACVTPDADQLAMLCASLPAAGGSSTIPGAVDSSPQVPSPPPISPLLIGALGLGLGVVIGLGLPAIQRGMAGSGGRAGRAYPPDPGFGAGHKVQTGATGGFGDGFTKLQDEAAQKVAPSLQMNPGPPEGSEHFSKIEGPESETSVNPGPPDGSTHFAKIEGQAAQKVTPSLKTNPGPPEGSETFSKIEGPGSETSVSPGPPNDPDIDTNYAK
ncbi:MAG TPA: hypothetical protein VIU38_03510 [Anaerolineales bacterium]